MDHNVEPHSCGSGRIYVCGAGIRMPHHFTVETLDLLDRCHLIYTVLPPSAASFLPTSLDGRFRSLWSLYKGGTLRRHAYEAMVETVVTAAEEQSPVGYLA